MLYFRCWHLDLMSLDDRCSAHSDVVVEIQMILFDRFETKRLFDG